MKYSPYGLFPPIHNGFAVGVTVPVRAASFARTPFTHRRSRAPSYVTARWDHALTGIELELETSWTDEPKVAPAAGRNVPAPLPAIKKYESACFCTTVLQPVWLAAGYTQASTVIPEVRSNDAASGTCTLAVEPLNESALPYLPEVVQDAPCRVPLLPFPDRSPTEVPDPSSNA